MAGSRLDGPGAYDARRLLLGRSTTWRTGSRTLAAAERLRQLLMLDVAVGAVALTTAGRAVRRCALGRATVTLGRDRASSTSRAGWRCGRQATSKRRAR